MAVQKRIWIRWAAAAAGVLLLFQLPRGCENRVTGPVGDLFAPVQAALLKGGRSLKEAVDTMRGFGGLVEENRRLSEELVRLQARLNVLSNMESENLRLRELLNFRRQQPRELIACQVVSRSVSDWWQSVRIDKGERDGVRPGRAVLSPDGLIGRTAHAAAHSAEVLLVSDPACRVSARIARTGSFGIVTGRGTTRGGYPRARMRFIHKDIPVQVGDQIVTSGLGGLFPRDLLIGYVDRVHTEETGLYQMADVIPKAVVELMDSVFVAADRSDGEGRP